MKALSFKQRIIAAVGDDAVLSTNAHADKIVCHKDGTVSVKRSYFYHNGMTPERWASQVLHSQEGEEAIGSFAVAIEKYDDWRAWPAASYFVVRLAPKKETTIRLVSPPAPAGLATNLDTVPMEAEK